MDDDKAVEDRIEELEAEIHRLRADEGAHAGQAGDPALEKDAARLAAISDELERQWELLRHRRALRAAGQDPASARLRESGPVEGYPG